MIELIDVENGKRKSAVRFVIHLIVVLLLIVGTATGSVLSLIYSTLDYQLNLVLNIVIDSLVVCFLIFYFFSIFPIVHHYYKIFKGMNPVAYDHRRDLTYVEEREIKTINNVKFRTFNFSYKEGEGTYQENLFVLDSDIELKAGAHYSVYAYQNIIVKLEEIKNATV